MQTSTTSEKDYSEARSKQAREELMLKKGFQDLCSTLAGRMIIWRLLSVCQLFEIPTIDPFLMAFHNGKRTVGLELMKWLDKHSPATYAQMQRENANVRIEDDRSNDDAA